MTRKKLMPYLLIALALLLFVVAELLIPKPLNWTITLSSEDKNPYGAYGLSRALEDLFLEQEIRNNNLTLYETDSFIQDFNYLILAENFTPTPPDTRVLLEKVNKGASAFIGASGFHGLFADTLHITTGNHLFESLADEGLYQKPADSVYLSFTDQDLPAEPFAYSLSAVPGYFDSLPENRQVLARNQLNMPVLVKIPYGKGSFYLSSTPLAFSNYYLLEGKNHGYIEASLSRLPVSPLLWTEYYQLGRLESQSPLRFLLSNAALRWAYYVGMCTLLLFLLFGIKRRQRPIPTMTAPENTSLQFAASIGSLYFQQGDHLNLARKKIMYLNEFIRSHYRLTAAWHDPEFIQQLSRKSNKAEEEIKSLAEQIHLAERKSDYTAEDLLKLNKAISLFYSTRSHDPIPMTQD